LGFFFADGSLDVGARGNQYFSFHIADKELLYAIRSAMNSDHQISLRTSETRGECYRLQIGSISMCKQLRAFGIREQKAHTMSLPPVPKSFFGDFVRGYFDGDGNVWTGAVHQERTKETEVIHTTFTSCSKIFLEALRTRLTDFGLGKGSLLFSRRAYRLQYSVNDSILLYRLMYHTVSGSIGLSRKRVVFERFMEMRS
jgi:hypothetical protein